MKRTATTQSIWISGIVLALLLSLLGIVPADAQLTDDTREAQVARLYEAYFLRSPSDVDRSYWVGQMQSGQTVDQISNFFAESPEFRDTYGVLDDAAFVDLVYRNVLGRERSTSETFWLEELVAGRRTRGTVMIGFANSDEFRQVLLDRFDDAAVFRLYCAYFLRPPDAGGRAFWKERYANGQSLDAISEAFAQSDEFSERYGNLSNNGFVTLIYANLLDRAPDQSGLNFWRESLGDGAARGWVMTRFSEAVEYRARFGSSGCPSNTYVPPTPEVPEGVIFETNFAADTGYSITGIQLWNGGYSSPTEPPNGWDGIKSGDGNLVSVISGEGIDGSNALRLQWNPEASQPTISLGKHLTGDMDSGYDEIYVRYHVRLPNRFTAGVDGEGIEHWKWGRLWQNTDPFNDDQAGAWTENRPNSGYVVWNWGGNIPYTDLNVTWGENSGDGRESGSAGGPRQSHDYFVSGSDQHSAPGYWESVWDFSESRPGELENNTAQTWHTVEFRFKLASTPTSDDGIFQFWIDGVDQGPWSRLGAGGGAPTRSGIPTANMGSGFNFLTFFDNMVGWNQEWGQTGVEGGIWVNDVVISSEPIGHGYLVTGDGS